MKIQTIVKNNINQTVKFGGGVKIKFDADGIAEVSDEIGKTLCEVHKDTIFPEGKVLRADVSPDINAKDSSVLTELKERLQRANMMTNDYKAQLSMARENERVWRTKCEELIQQITVLKKQQKTFVEAPEIKKPVVTRPGNPAEEDSKKDPAEVTLLRDKLNTKSLKELQSIAVELSLTGKEYEKLNKTSLIDLLIEKTHES